MSKISLNDRARFDSRVSRDGDCWNWIGGKRNGYGVIGMHGVTYMTHRIAYALANPDAEDMMLQKRSTNGRRTDYVLHSCDNRSCVNPAHLRLGDASDNSTDNLIRGRTCHGRPPVPKGQKRGSRPVAERPEHWTGAKEAREHARNNKGDKK